ncbi:MBL fold metallo-hydrolase RNA specificity domain-containing protein [Hydrogenimonas urashimensis]|uniref:MBL fold metallo-hydrolase RNA specificity domain-containing protein n=1 Tax=Hydrogenimonas urashimensis TaxID=2740515 RepID=UPI00191644DA|nr:MBL fold metallo-hydrolase [Hydrogenimonas urashimensis]
MAIVQSFGAAEEVTGSCHLLKLRNGLRILIDCGMFQGEGEDEKNRQHFGFDPRKVDILLITHAHLDHVGRIPKLVKEGFDGIIVATKATFELAQVVLFDSAKLMEEEYRTRYRKAQRRGEEKSVPKPLYTTEDVEDTWLLTHIRAKYDRPLKVAKGVKVIFRNAGHILGSATVEIRFKEEGKTHKVVFSGDLGNRDDLVMPYVENVPEADMLFIESTYGDRNHKNMKETIKEFKKAIRKTLLNRGNVIIPSFAIERTQEVLCILKDMYRERELPRCKVFLDSPMAIKATHLFSKFHRQLGPKCNLFYKEDGDVFDFPYLRFTCDVESSKKINEIERGAIIIAGSGMCTGGRILHHFKNRLWNERNCVIFVGYQAEGTLGRYIVDGVKWVRIYREEIRIRAKIYTINGFSAHADQQDLIDWIAHIKKLGKICLVHGEREKQSVFKKAIREKVGKRAHIVRPKEKIYL